MHTPDRLLRLWLRTGRTLRGENGMTGLETAIILIAFVVVASVFAYVVLSAGIFSSQKAEETIHAGMEQVSSSVAPSGSMMATATTGSGQIDDCDSWVVYNATNCTAMDGETGTGNYSSGTGGVKLTFATLVAPTLPAVTVDYDLAYRYFSPAVDISDDSSTAIKAWVKCSQSFATATTTDYTLLILLDDDSDPFADPLETLTFTGADWSTATEITSSNTLGAGASTGIVSVGIGIRVADADDTDTDLTGADLYLDNIRVADASPTVENCDSCFETSGGTSNVDGTASDKKEGTGSVYMDATALVDDAYFAYHDISTTGVDLSVNSTIQMWLKCTTTISTTGEISLVLSETATAGGGSFTASEAMTIPAVTANIWTQVTMSLSGTTSNYDLVRALGIRNTSGANTSINIYVDNLEGPESMSNVIFTIANAVGADPVDTTNPLDTDSDGVGDSTSENSIVIAYADEDQRVNDIAWSSTFTGKNDSDILLEEQEKLEITVDLTAINDPALSTNKTFTIEVKTAIGAPLRMERTTPAHLDSVMVLT